MPQNIMACRICSDVLRVPKVSQPFEFVLCGDCCYEETVFHSLTGTSWQYDIRSFLKRRLIETDTIEYRILKNGVEVATIIDDTYGEFFNGFPEQPLYVGVYIYFNLIFGAFGNGIYQIRCAYTEFGQDKIADSHFYRLMEYSEEAADGTVRIDTYQNGCIESSDIDFSGLNWFQSIRIDGRFGDKNPELTSDKYQDSSRLLNQIQDSIRNTYTLETHLLPSVISNHIIYDGMLANETLITDYNIFSNEPIRELSVYPESIEDPKYFERNRDGIFEFKFTDKLQNTIKRNFK